MISNKDWELWEAPVVPPTKVINQILLTKSPCYWINTNGIVADFLMVYRSYILENQIITNLVIGPTPVKGWLRKIQT